MDRFGPLAHLIGDWEGDSGVDVSFHHADDTVGETRYREVTSFKPFGPVDNGTQSLFGLDYKTAAWRLGEDDPFHTEVGYWLWCKDLGHVMRGFVIPRGSTILAGGPAAADATSFTMKASHGDPEYGISANPYLESRATTLRYECTIEVSGDTFSYDEDTVLLVKEYGDEELHHTDRNTLRRVGTYELPPR